PAGARARQIELLAERIPPLGPLVLPAQVAPQVVGVQPRMYVQVGNRRRGVHSGRIEGGGVLAEIQCCVTRTVVFICLPVSRSRADMVRIPSMFTSKVISSRAFPAGPVFRPLKRKSPSSSFCATCGAS